MRQCTNLLGLTRSLEAFWVLVCYENGDNIFQGMEKQTRLRIPQEFPRNSLGIPFFGFSDLGNGVPF